MIGFLALVGGWRATMGTLAAVGASSLRSSRDELKAVLIRRMLKGRLLSDLAEMGQAYSERIIQQRLRPTVVERIESHRSHGDQLAIVSASLHCYLDPVAAHLGIDTVLCTELEVDEHGIVTGELRGANCRGAEKVRRIEERFGPAWANIWCYGDSAGDAAMLSRAARGVQVTRAGDLRSFSR